MTEPFKQQLQELIDQAAEKYVFETNGHKWSNNNDECGDNFGSFKQGCEFLMPVIESLIEIRNNYVNFRGLYERAPELIIQNDKDLLNILKGEGK